MAIHHGNKLSVFLFLFLRENNSVSIEPMDDDFYNNNITNSKPGVKRRAADDLQSGISQVKVNCMAISIKLDTERVQTFNFFI